MSLLVGHATALALIKQHVAVGSLIVDAGAFPGHLTQALHEAGYRMLALDLEPERGLGIQTRFQKGMAQVDGETTFGEVMRRVGIEVRAVDLEKPWGIADASCDAVLMTEVIEHLWVDPLTAVAEVRRVLKPGGKLILSTPDLLSIKKRVAFARGMPSRVMDSPRRAFDQKRAIGHIGHLRLYAPGEIVEMLEGFTCEFQFHQFDFWDDPTPKAQTARKVFKKRNYLEAVVATGSDWAQRRYPELREHMYVVARKG